MDKYMENIKLYAKVAELTHQRDRLGQLLGECIVAAGITNPDIPLDGPQLLMFGTDLLEHLKGCRLDKDKQ